MIFLLQCSEIHHLDSNFTSCDFVQCVEGCGSEAGLLNYLHFIYCFMPHKLIPLAMILLVGAEALSHFTRRIIINLCYIL